MTNTFTFAVDGDGMPTSQLALDLLRYLFQERNRFRTVNEIALTLGSSVQVIRRLCGQLYLAGLVTRRDGEIAEFKYNVHSSNVELQTKLEGNLLDLATPAHLNLLRPAA
jgi:hypothetical protein